jgi:uncharacterized membrane protein
MHDSSRPRPDRLPPIDMARGIALAAMITYHFSWDLAYHTFVDWDVATSPPWRTYAIVIAAAFLVLAGIGLVLAARDGFDGAAFVRRVVRIAAAAGLVSAVTFLAFPDTYVYFGVLHMIALGSVLALPFLRAPIVVTLLAAVAVALAPRVLTGGVPDSPELAFLGLTASPPPANDYVPVFPWFAAMLVGVVAGRLIVSGTLAVGTAAPTGAVGRVLAWAGRRSLAIYLIHQPVLFGLVALAATVLPADPRVERSSFVGDCVKACSLGDDECRAFCTCVAGALDGTGSFSGRRSDDVERGHDRGDDVPPARAAAAVIPGAPVQASTGPASATSRCSWTLSSPMRGIDMIE